MEKLVFQESPAVNFGSNIFIDVPIILQVDETPLIEVVKTQQGGYTTEIPIYHNDGTYLAKVKGSQLYSTPEGEKAGVKLRHPDLMTVCELNGNVIFELKRTEAAALKASAELYTPNGFFVKCADTMPSLVSPDGSSINVGGVTMSGNVFQGIKIGVHLSTKGSVGIGAT